MVGDYIKCGYETYREEIKNVTALPAWEDLSPQLKEVWDKVAQSIIDEYNLQFDPPE